MSSNVSPSGPNSNVTSLSSDPRLPPFSSVQATDSARMNLENCITRIKQFIQKIKLGIPNGNVNLTKISCPITLAIPNDPVVTNCGHIYERIAIQDWKNNGGPCKLCATPITTLTPNLELRNLIETWQKEDPIPTCSKFKNLDQPRAAKYIELAKSLIDEKDYTEALEAYGKALQYTNSSEVYADIPTVYEQLGDSKKALLSRLYLALYQIQEGKIPEALQTLLSCESEDLTLTPFLGGLSLQSSQSQEKIAQALTNALQQENIEDRIFIYKQIIAHAPDQLEAYKQLIPLIKDPTEKKDLQTKAANQLSSWAKQFDLKVNFRSEEERPIFRFGEKTPSSAPTEKLSRPQHQACESKSSDSEKIAEKRHVKQPSQQPAEGPVISAVITTKMWAAASTINLPPYPQELQDFLTGECDFWPEKKRSETHIVVPLFPQVLINGARMPLTLETLSQLDTNSGGRGCFSVYTEISKSTPAETEFRYAVMTKDLIPESCSGNYNEVLWLLPPGYEVPGTFDAARAILWETRRSRTLCFKSNPSTDGIRSPSKEHMAQYGQPTINTYCKETVSIKDKIYQQMVGAFTMGRGLRISVDPKTETETNTKGFGEKSNKSPGMAFGFGGPAYQPQGTGIRTTSETQANTHGTIGIAAWRKF